MHTTAPTRSCTPQQHTETQHPFSQALTSRREDSPGGYHPVPIEYAPEKSHQYDYILLLLYYYKKRMVESDAGSISVVVNHEFWGEEIDFTKRREKPRTEEGRRVCQDCGKQETAESIAAATQTRERN